MSAQCPTMIAAMASAGLSAFFKSKFDRPAATAMGMIAAMIEPMTIRTNRKFSAMRMAISCQLARTLSRPRRRTSVVLRKSFPVIGNACELDLFGHFVEAAAQALADAIFEIVRKVRRENRRALPVVAGVDQVIEDVLHEHRRLLRSELVEHEQIDLQQRPQNLRFARRFVRIERGLNLLDEILKIAEEQTSRFSAVDDLQQRGDGEMGLARAARAHQQQAARSEEHTSELQSRGHLVC